MLLSKYVPAAQEPVVGIVSARQGEGWRVDIGGAHQASLDGLAFEGASRRNRPNLKVCSSRTERISPDCNVNINQVNSLIYARVSLAHKDMEPELECFDAQTRKAEGFGELKGGFLVRCSLKMSRKCVALSFTACSDLQRVSQPAGSKLLPSASAWIPFPPRCSGWYERQGLD
jgi:exosome complex RNA-binding protein Rrp4